jgi:hypothetical protein
MGKTLTIERGKEKKRRKKFLKTVGERVRVEG